MALVALHLNIAYAQSLDAQSLVIQNKDVHNTDNKNGDIKAVPTSINHFYTDMDMRVRLATKPNEAPCSGDQCLENKIFDLQVQQIGQTLSDAAYQVYPELKNKIPHFTFNIANKKEAGMASNGSGKIVVFRGIQHLNLSDDALAFVMAREMGHVIGGHHDKNTSTKIFFSIMAGVLFPAVTLISASNVAAQATTATSVATSAASTATSYFGSEAAISMIKPTQLMESDEIAIKLLNVREWDKRAVDTALQVNNPDDNSWVKDLEATQKYLARKIEQEDADVARLGVEIQKDRSSAITGIK